jgi:hypothetical protein
MVLRSETFRRWVHLEYGTLMGRIRALIKGFRGVGLLCEDTVFDPSEDIAIRYHLGKRDPTPSRLLPRS